MTSFIFSFFIIFVNFYCSAQKNIIEEAFKNVSNKINEELEPDYGNLKEWLHELVIDLPNELIKEETKVLENLTLYEISLDRIITTSPKIIENKIGVTISVENVALNAKGIYDAILSDKKNFIAHISNLNVQLPFYLVKDPENGLVSEVDTSGFTIDLDNVVIDVEIDMIFKDLIVNILIGILKLIKTNVIEKNLIDTMNEKLGELFEKANDIILNGVEPKTLNIVIKEQDRLDLKKSSIISAVGYLLNNLTGAEGPLSLNNLVNIITYDTGIIHLHEFYNKSIHFNFNLTNKDNSSLGNFEIGLEDLNISGLNTWKNFTALEPYNKLLLRSYTDLQDLNASPASVKIQVGGKITGAGGDPESGKDAVLASKDEILRVHNIIQNGLK